MGSYTGGVICIVLLTEVSKFVRDVEVIEFVSKWKYSYCVYFFERK